MTAELYKLALQFRTVDCQLKEVKAQLFANPMPVKVDAPRYRGYGVTWRNSDEPADAVSVLLENGNIWQYPIETLTVVPWSEVDAATRRAYLRYRGKGCWATSGPRRALP